MPRGHRGPGARRRRRRRANLVRSVISAKPAEWLDSWEWHWERLTAERIQRHRRLAKAAPPGSTLRLWHERRAHGLAAPVDEVVSRCRTTRMEMGCGCSGGALGMVTAVRPVGCGRRLVCKWCARQAARKLGRRIEETIRSRLWHSTKRWEEHGSHGMAPAVYLLTMGVRHRDTLTESAAALDRAWRVFSSRIACEEGPRQKAMWRRAYVRGLDRGEIAQLEAIELREPKARTVRERRQRVELRAKAIATLDEKDRAWLRARDSAADRGEKHWMRQSCAVLEVAAGSTGEGHIHVHVVAIARWIDVKKLREQWTRATCEDCSAEGRASDGSKCAHGGRSASPVVHLSRSKEKDPSASAASYVSKYIAKGVETDEDGDVMLSPQTYAETMAVHVGRRMLRTSRGWWVYTEEEAEQYGLAYAGRNDDGSPHWTVKDRRRWAPSLCPCCEREFCLVTPPPPVMLTAPSEWLGRRARAMGPPHRSQLGLGAPTYQDERGEWMRWR